MTIRTAPDPSAKIALTTSSARPVGEARTTIES
jgi:hypothetical protein